jgi:hypothetical protein
MPVHMGVMCEACGKVHFVATSRGIQLSRTVEGMYRLTCNPPCPETREFRKEGMHPYRVSDDVFKRGYAEEGEYELVQKG